MSNAKVYVGSPYGVGTYVKGKYKSRNGGKKTREYSRWFGMLSRCYEEVARPRNVTYAECTVDETFLDFQKFCQWGEDHMGFFEDGYHLDKDLMVPGNKLYSPSTCLMLPAKINNFLSIHRKNGCKIVGAVYYKKRGNYIVNVSCGKDKNYHGGYFDTEEEAGAAYKNLKEKVAKDLAEEFKTKMSASAYDALYNYKVTYPSLK